MSLASSRRRDAVLLAFGLLATAPAPAQTPDYFAPRRFELGWSADLALTQEWTEAFGRHAPESRRRARLLAGALGRYRSLGFGLTGDFTYGSDDNVALLGSRGYVTQRDNFRSRDARLDQAFVSVTPASWLRLDAGRFPMPIGLTGLVWDEDLRPQGAALALQARDLGSVTRLRLTGLGARGSHVFDDAETGMWAIATDAELRLGERTSLELTGAFVAFTGVDGLERALWRQNGATPGGFVRGYEIADLVARLSHDGAIEAELVVDLCRNLAADEDENGVWLALVVDGALQGWPRLEYVYAWVDYDAVLGAYAADDYLWTTGWEGHAVRLGVRVGSHAIVRAIGQLQRYKDAPQEQHRDDWVGRARLRLELSF
ncbi:MAG: putative porin [Vicinamibacteria bacterium]